MDPTVQVMIAVLVAIIGGAGSRLLYDVIKNK